VKGAVAFGWRATGCATRVGESDAADELRPAFAHDQLTAVTAETMRTAEALWSACEDLGLVSRDVAEGVEAYVTPRHFRTVFSDPVDCRRLREATLARLACA
jgi:hypothetical protein